MGKERFLKVHLDHVVQLDGYHLAEIYFEYLKMCQANPYIVKDQDGFFSRAKSQIEQDIYLKRSIQEKARIILLTRGWIVCRIKAERSPTIHFKIVG